MVAGKEQYQVLVFAEIRERIMYFPSVAGRLKSIALSPGCNVYAMVLMLGNVKIVTIGEL